jgi:hypothetical protein
VNSSFAPIGQLHDSHAGDNSFWPSFTDIMMVITMIFLMATSLLVVRNWQLVSELKESIAAEQIASATIEYTVQENATLEERLANAEQSNSILRLRALKKDEELRQVEIRMREQQTSISQLNTDRENLNQSLELANKAADVATLEIDRISAQNKKISKLLLTVEQQLAEQKQQTEQTRSQLTSAEGEIAALTQSSLTQQQNISGLTEEKLRLNEAIDAYNQEILTLKGEYEVVKSKYEELIRPARSAKGKYIAEVYYVKGTEGHVIRYKQPGQTKFINLSLTEVEQRLNKLKREKGKDLYVKIIIPENSGLTYNEAWTFMRSLLVKYDYYYQDK